MVMQRIDGANHTKVKFWSLKSVVLGLDRLFEQEKTLDVHEKDLWRFWDAESDVLTENINRMSPLLCGMFPLRIHARPRWKPSAPLA